jgi:hypothetical protein
MRYVKKPMEVEAVQFDGSPESAERIVRWVEDNDGLATYSGSGSVLVRTLEGDMQAPAGWWIIRGIDGEFYPCRDDIFHNSYDPVQS